MKIGLNFGLIIGELLEAYVRVVDLVKFQPPFINWYLS